MNKEMEMVRLARTTQLVRDLKDAEIEAILGLALNASGLLSRELFATWWKKFLLKFSLTLGSVTLCRECLV